MRHSTIGLAFLLLAASAGTSSAPNACDNGTAAPVEDFLPGPPAVGFPAPHWAYDYPPPPRHQSPGTRQRKRRKKARQTGRWA